MNFLSGKRKSIDRNSLEKNDHISPEGVKIKSLEEEVGTYKSEIEKLKAKINELQDAVIQPPEDDDLLLDDKLKYQLKVSNRNNESKEDRETSRIQFHFNTINSIVSSHHLAHSNCIDTDLSFFEHGIKAREYAAELAYTYALEFGAQEYRQKILTKFDKTSRSLEDPYPVKWLLKVFPIMENVHTNELIANIDDGLWLPVHFTLAVTTTTDSESDYLVHLQSILREFGESAYEYAVSPLSIAVGKSAPSIDVVKTLIAWKADAVSREDEDGSLPFMHACAYNESTHVIEYLYNCYPDAIHKRDNFGLSAIHYAAFSGSAVVVKYLIELDNMNAFLTLDNGCLPLHDAVQNRRNFGGKHEMIELLLVANPHAPLKCDDFGELPLHKAAKYGDMEVVKLIYEAYPEAMFIADKEGLLPIHFYSERPDKNAHLELIDFILKVNSSSQTLEQEKDAYNQGILKASFAKKQQQQGGGRRRSMFEALSPSSWQKPPLPPPPASTSSTYPTTSGKDSTGGGASGKEQYSTPIAQRGSIQMAFPSPNPAVVPRDVSSTNLNSHYGTHGERRSNSDVDSLDEDYLDSFYAGPDQDFTETSPTFERAPPVVGNASSNGHNGRSNGITGDNPLALGGANGVNGGKKLAGGASAGASKMLQQSPLLQKSNPLMNGGALNRTKYRPLSLSSKSSQQQHAISNGSVSGSSGDSTSTTSDSATSVSACTSIESQSDSYGGTESSEVDSQSSPYGQEGISAVSIVPSFNSPTISPESSAEKNKDKEKEKEKREKNAPRRKNSLLAALSRQPPPPPRVAMKTTS